MITITDWKVVTAITLAIALTVVVTTVGFAAYINSQKPYTPSETYSSYGTNGGITTNPPTGTTPQPSQTPIYPPTTPNYPQNIYPYNGYPQNTYPAQPYAPYTPAYPYYGPGEGRGGWYGNYYPGYGFGGHE